MVSAIVNVGLNFVLMPTLGMIGAAVTTVIAELVNCMMQMCFSKAFFDWRTLEVKPIVSCICGSAFIGITCLLCNGFFHNSLMKMAFYLGSVYKRYHSIIYQTYNRLPEIELKRLAIDYNEIYRKAMEDYIAFRYISLLGGSTL